MAGRRCTSGWCIPDHDVADANAGGDERAKLDFLREVRMLPAVCIRSKVLRA